MDILFREKNINFELIKRITKCRTNWAGIGKQTDKKIICDLHADMVAVVSKSRSHRRGFTTTYTGCPIWNSTEVKRLWSQIYTGKVCIF